MGRLLCIQENDLCKKSWVLDFSLPSLLGWCFSVYFQSWFTCGKRHFTGLPLPAKVWWCDPCPLNSCTYSSVAIHTFRKKCFEFQQLPCLFSLMIVVQFFCKPRTLCNSLIFFTDYLSILWTLYMYYCIHNTVNLGTVFSSSSHSLLIISHSINKSMLPRWKIMSYYRKLWICF